MDTGVVLAAGRGTRMGSLTAATPKPLLEVGGQPLIAHVLDGLAQAGLRRIVVVTGYLGERIEAALGGGERFGVEIRYCRQERPDGTARALLLAEPHVGRAPFLLCWGDILVSRGFYRELAGEFARVPCDALLGVNEVDDPWQGAAVYADRDWRVTRLEEKPPRGTSATRWNNAGILVLTAVAFDYARRLRPSPRGEYEMPQAIAQMVADGLRVRAHSVRGEWADVGTPADLAAVRARWASASGAGGESTAGGGFASKPQEPRNKVPLPPGEVR